MLTYNIKEQIKSNLINVLLTEQGERVNLPNFGVGLKNLLFENNINLPLLEEKINQQINLYIPNVSLANVQTGLSEDQHTIFISIVYRYLLDNSTDSIQLNFN